MWDGRSYYRFQPFCHGIKKCQKETFEQSVVDTALVF